MDATLTDRYVDAAMRTVPEAQRSDLAAELRASIEDQIDARVDDGDTREDAERAVLESLGDPDRLAAGYMDRPQWLIGPAYYFDWLRLLKLLLWIVPPLAAFGIALGKILSGAGIGDVIGSTVSGLIGVIVHLAFWTTLVFALIERSTRKAKTPLMRWSVDQLPLPRESGATFADMLATIIFLTVAAGALVWDQLIGVVYLDGEWHTFLDPGLWPWWIGGLLVAMAAEATLSIVVFLRRHWTYALAAVNAILSLVVAVPALWLLSQQRLLDEQFWLTIIPGDGAEVFRIISVITGFGIGAIALWDIIDGFLKARRARVG